MAFYERRVNLSSYKINQPTEKKYVKIPSLEQRTLVFKSVTTAKALPKVTAE